MSKALVVADIHINDYTNRNPYNKFRLLQGSVTVANNIIKVGKQENCDIIIFDGDIIEKSIIRPFIQSEVKNFLDTIMAEFKEGYLIYGNHDLDSKSVNQDMTDACLGIMLPSNLHYSHQKITQIDGTTIGFCNWMPEFDLSWIPNKVDILFTHATICYAKDASEGRLFTSQYLDENKFDLAICGDIHKKGQIGKYVSVGVPQRCKLSDPEESTGVVVDFTNKNWKWVNLNPDDNLMKFKTTNDLKEDGWHKDEFTWYVHKNDISFVDPSGKIRINTWQEISAMIDEAISNAGLQNIHQEVLKNITNIDASEVDFSFTLKKLRCKNWRSIEYAELNFEDGDKILVQGSNGSGKSSLLSAIKYAFMDCSGTIGLSSLKPFIQFGKKDCFSEVEFNFQGNDYKITRSTVSKDCGFWVNGEQMKYNNKGAFEKDLRDRFKFLGYITSFMYDADKNSFLKSLKPEEIADITFKALKLDKINTYHDTAVILHSQFKTQAAEWISKLGETEKLLQYIQEKLDSTNLPPRPKNDYIKGKQEGLELQRKNVLWNNYTTTSAKFTATIDHLNNKINDLTIKQCNFRNTAIIDSEISQINQEIKDLHNKAIELGNIKSSKSWKQKELDSLMVEGNKVWQERNNIGIGKTCNHCGQIIQTTQALQNHVLELDQRINEIKGKIEVLNNELKSLEPIVLNAELEYNNIQLKISALNSEVTNRMSEKAEIQNTASELKNCKSTLINTQAELQKLGVVEKVLLPDGFMEKMAEIETAINTWTIYENTEKDKAAKLQDYQIYYSQVTNYNQILYNLDNYIKLTGPTGIIFEAVFNKLSTEFSNNTVQYRVERKGTGIKEHLFLTPYYNNSGNWVNIEMCSSGQRVMLDLNYLANILGQNRLGLLVLDEFLKVLDSDKLEEAVEILKDMNVGCMLLTSHAESIPVFYNKSCMMSLNDKGLTDIVFK